MRNYNKLLALKCYFLLLCEIFMQKTDNCVYLSVSGNYNERHNLKDKLTNAISNRLKIYYRN